MMGSPRDGPPGDGEATVVDARGEQSADGPSPADERVPMPVQLGRFRVLETLGSGGMGVVYLAEDPDLGRRVAIKLLHERIELASHGRARLEREARTLASLSHPNVVHVYETGAHDGHVFVAMEYVPGQSLRAWLREREHERPWTEIVAVFCAAGEGLAAAHRAGIVHRDFKPDNVLVDPDGRPRVLDFGLAGHFAAPLPSERVELGELEVDGLTATGTVMGTPAYMAPEQYTGQPVDARSDQFAFCVALFEALFGVRPFSGDTLAQMRDAVLAGRVAMPRSRGGIPRHVIAALQRGLAAAPADRFAQLTDLLAELLEAIAPHRSRAGLALAFVAAVAVSAAAIGIALPRAEVTDARARGDAAAPEEPWRLSLRPLTKTSPPGIDSVTLDRSGTRLAYAIQRELWRRPVDGGAPEAVTLPGAGFVWWLGAAPGEDELFAEIDGKLWRFTSAADARPVLDGLGRGRIAIDPAGTRAAVLGDDQLAIRTLGPGRTITVPLPDEIPYGAAWSRDGSRVATTTEVAPDRLRVRVFDADGIVHAMLELPHSPTYGLAWLGADRLVVPSGTLTALALRCLSYDEGAGALVELRHSEELPHPSATIEIQSASDEGALLTEHVRQVLDAAVGPATSGADAWTLLSPELEAGNRGPAWIDDDTLALYSERDLRPTAVTHALSSGRVTAIDRLTAPLRRLSVMPDRTIVAIVGAEGGTAAAVQIVPPDGSAVRTVPGTTALASEALDLRCDSASRCVFLGDDGSGARFTTLTPSDAAVVVRTPCPSTHVCTRGTFAPSADGTRVLVPARGHRRLDWIDLDTGLVVAPGPVAPTGYEIGSGTAVPGTDDVIATLTLDATAQSEGPGYQVVRIAKDGTTQTLWTSMRTYFRRPVVSPDGRRVAVDAASFHHDAALLEGAARCAGS